jgi:hypothetical protein
MIDAVLTIVQKRAALLAAVAVVLTVSFLYWRSRGKSASRGRQSSLLSRHRDSVKSNRSTPIERSTVRQSEKPRHQSVRAPNFDALKKLRS